MATARERGKLLAAVAEQLRVEAARQRMSVRALGAASGVAYATTQKALAGGHVIDVTELHRLARGLGLTASEIMRRAEVAYEAGGGVELADDGQDPTQPPSGPRPGRAPRKQSAPSRQG